jgi:hypothetical protein
MIRTAKDALALVKRHRVVPMTPVEGFRSLVTEVAGGPVRGSWWGHPKGSLMFDLANVLHNSRQVVAAKLVEGKVTFIHKSLWPALLRVVSDEGWRRSSVRRFGPLERRILSAVEAKGRMEADPRSKKATDRLAQGMALLTANHHTEKGSHATILTSWSAWATAPTRAAARRLGFDEALETLRSACGGVLYGLSHFSG